MSHGQQYLVNLVQGAKSIIMSSYNKTYIPMVEYKNGFGDIETGGLNVGMFGDSDALYVFLQRMRCME